MQTVERHKLLKIPGKECQGNIDAVVHHEDAKVGTASISKKILHKRRCNSNTLLKSRKSLIKEDQDFRLHDVNEEVPCNSEAVVDRSYPKPKRMRVKGCQKSATHYQTNCSMSLRSLKKQFSNAAVEESEQSPDISVKAKYSSVIKGSGGTANRSDRKIKATDSELQRKHLKRSNIDVQVEVPEAILSLTNNAEIQDGSNIKLPELPASTHQQREPEKLSSDMLDKRGKHIHQNKCIAKDQASELKVTSAVKVPATPMGTAACESNKISCIALKEYKRSLAVKNTRKNRIQARGSVLQRKPISRDNKRLLGDTSTCRTLIVFSIEHPEKHNCNSDTVTYHRRSEAQSLADASGGTLAGSTWIIDSIAACKLQPLS
ncbi:hypothetical protein GW17_00031250 [Ensete ventricosum]|nr:hypothetical protein GW17_00031250 [Ensete ventricosum]